MFLPTLIVILFMCCIVGYSVMNKQPLVSYSKVNNLIVGADEIESSKVFNTWSKHFLIFGLVLVLTIGYVGLRYEIDTFERFDIASASVEQLNSISGIGNKKANLIYLYIERNGIDSYEELLEINGVGELTVHKLEKFTTLDKPIFGGD